MNCIYWDTTTEWIVVEIFSLNQNSDSPIRVLYSKKEYRPKDAAFNLVQEIQIGLHSARISAPDCIFVAKGPGAFTGIRIAVAAARNLAQLWKIPCIGIDSLQIYADYYFKKNQSQDCIVLLDGKMNSYFTAIRSLRLVPQEWATRDISLSELDHIIKEKFNDEVQIFSYTTIQRSSKTFSNDFPGILGTSYCSKWKAEELTFEKYRYDTLLPKYMRGTYATQTIPKN
jgi:tRNA threonylcarbamoyl adenosine modification protein YeaZ